MSDRWESVGRKHCSFCNCYYANNKASIESHERGATHIANVERELRRTRRNEQDLELAQRIFASELQKIEAAAMKSFEEDAKRNPFAQNELERVQQARGRPS